MPDAPQHALHALHALQAEGVPVAHDLTGLLSLPACALTLVPYTDPTQPVPDPAPDPLTVVATGATLAEAVRTASERALSRSRARAAGRLVPYEFPAISREQESDAPRPQSCTPWSHPLDALRAHGHSPVAVPLDNLDDLNHLDHQAPGSGELPYLVRIVLSAAQPRAASPGT